MTSYPWARRNGYGGLVQRRFAPIAEVRPRRYAELLGDRRAEGPTESDGATQLRRRELAGTIDLRFAGESLAPGQVNVAYGLYPSWRGRGPATRAVLLASQYAAGADGKDGTRFEWYIRDLLVVPR